MFHVQAPFSSLTLLNVYTTAVYLNVSVLTLGHIGDVFLNQYRITFCYI